MKLENSWERQGNFGKKRTEYAEGEGKRTKREIWEVEQIIRKERDGLIKDKKKMKYQDEIKRRKNEKGENIEEGEKKRKKRNVRW